MMVCDILPHLSHDNLSFDSGVNGWTSGVGVPYGPLGWDQYPLKHPERATLVIICLVLVILEDFIPHPLANILDSGSNDRKDLPDAFPFIWLVGVPLCYEVPQEYPGLQRAGDDPCCFCLPGQALVKNPNDC